MRGALGLGVQLSAKARGVRDFLRTLLLGCAIATTALASAASPEQDHAEKVYPGLLKSVNAQRYRGFVTDITNLGSRMAGSEGESKTLEYAEAQLRRLGLTNIRREPFTITVPDPESRGTLKGANFETELLPLWPNLVRTSTCEVQGALIYGGDGSLPALNGKQIKGSIVLIEFDSGPNWRNAAKLGAKAVVFIEPKVATRLEGESKYSSVPLSFPRFWLSLKAAAPVLTAAMKGETVSLKCRQDWVVRQTSNLLADLPATTGSKSEPLQITAYADAMSIAPGLAPGAEAAANLGALLETAEILKTRARNRPITFLITSAHHLALQGTREYIEQRLVQQDAIPFLTLSLDVTSGTGNLSSSARGWFTQIRNEALDPMRNLSRLLRRHVDMLAPLVDLPNARLALIDATNDSDGRPWRNNVPGKFALDCEPFLLSGMNALSFMTVEDARKYVDTPSDTIGKLNWANLEFQLGTLAVLFDHLANDPSKASGPTEMWIPLKESRPGRMTLTGGFAVLEGRVAIFDPEKSFVPDVPVPGALAVLNGRQRTFMGVRGDMVQMTTGDKSRYRFIGVTPVSAHNSLEQMPASIGGYHLDPATGNIDVAPRRGIMGSWDYPLMFRLTSGYKSTPIVVFPCVATDLYDLVDPQDLKGLEELIVMDGATDSEPIAYGRTQATTDNFLGNQMEDSAVLFTEKGDKVKLLLTSALGEVRLILTNGTPENPEGSGYAGGEPLDSIPYRTTKDILTLNESRLQQFRKHRIISQGVDALQAKAVAELQAADEAKEKLDWAAFQEHSMAAYGYALRAHPVIHSTTNDVVNGVLFYLLLLIPFSYFLERLTVASRSLARQLVWALGIFILSFVALRFIHPAFLIVTNPSMIFIAFVMGVLSVVVAVFILGKFETSLQEVKALESGLKEVDIRRGSVAMAAFSLGVGNMRRRRARSLLTTLTLVVMTFIVLSFTSIVPDLQIRELGSNAVPRYSGLLLRDPGLNPLDTTSYRLLRTEFHDSGSVVRRVWFYGAELSSTAALTLKHGSKSADGRAAVGLDFAENTVVKPQEALRAGRWFKDGEKDAMLLPESLAAKLGITDAELGAATVDFGGGRYTVIGILDEARLRALTDLDGDGFLPADFSLSKDFQQQTRTGNEAFRRFIRLDPDVCFIIPAENALQLGADVRSVAVGLADIKSTRARLEQLMPRLRLNLYGTVEEAGAPVVKQFSVQQGSKGTGLGLVLIQLLIASVFVLNTMVASVFERTREISIFSAIGLAPNHISMLFFAESLVYGVLGAVFGYIGAQITARIIIATGALPELQLNFSSTSAVLAAALVVGVVLLSTIYPARKASQIAAPALEEDLTSAPPDGDEWVVQMPFRVSRAEAASLVPFLGEWLKAFEEYTIGNFVSSKTAIQTEGDTFTASSEVWLAPYDLGISQAVRLIASPSNIPDVYELELFLTRLSGEPGNWVTLNQRFFEDLRKQFLTWRTIAAQQEAA